MKKNLLVSFSGGETSAFMVDWLIKNKSDQYNMYFVFANTSKENEETLIFANEIDKEYSLNLYWIEAKFDNERGVGYNITNFKDAKRNGEIFENMIKCYGIPCKPYPHCSRELKEQPITRFAKEVIGDYYTAIGIRADESDRISNNRKKLKYYYPLIEDVYTTKQHVNKFWNEKPYRLELKGYEGNCDLCWKKSNRKLLTNIIENPSKMDWWLEMEEKYSNYVPSHRDRKHTGEKLTFFRNNLSAVDLINMSKEDFDKATDDSINYDIQQTLWGYDLDSSNGCEESCEPF
jgi:hypothetical protein